MGSCYGTFDRLESRCRELGYHGICPEALELIADGIEHGDAYEDDLVRREYRRFMAGLRALLAPV
jgi:hypothetical protein